MAKYQLPIGERYEVPQDKILVGNMLFPRQIAAFQTDAKIDNSKYALVQDGDIVVAVSTFPRYFSDGGKNFADANIDALKDDLIVTSPRIFLRSWADVNSALRGEGVRYNSSGKLIETEQTIRDAQVVNSAWVYLNARFPQGAGFRGLDIVTITGIKDGNPVFTRMPLNRCLEEVCLADVESMNEQGMLTQKAKTNEYEPGKTVTFFPPSLRKDKPEEGFVAGFDAISVRAYLICGRNDSIRNASLGVFTSAKNFCSSDSEGEDSNSKNFSEGASLAENGGKEQ